MTSCILSIAGGMEQQPISGPLLIAEPPPPQARGEGGGGREPGSQLLQETITGRASKRPQASSGIINSELALFASQSPSRFSEKLGRKSTLTSLAFFPLSAQGSAALRLLRLRRLLQGGNHVFLGWGLAVPGAQGQV